MLIRLSIFFIFLASFAATRCVGPPLRVVQTNDGVTIDVRTLGEYVTSIERIRLTDVAKNVVVWEIEANTGEPQIDKIELRPGVNIAMPSNATASGTYRVVVPMASADFLLERGRAYSVEVFGTRGNKAAASFVL